MLAESYTYSVGSREFKGAEPAGAQHTPLALLILIACIVLLTSFMRSMQSFI